MSIRKTVSAIVATLSCSSVVAAPLITKTNSSGFTIEPTTKVCSVYDYWVKVKETKYTQGDTIEKTRYYYHRKGRKIRRTLSNIKNENLISSPNYLCDGPTTNITASTSDESLVLFDSGACGSDRLERQGPKTELLTRIVNQYCPVTHDIVGPVEQVEFQFDMSETAEAWEVGFSDFPIGSEDQFELNSEWKALPAPLSGKGILVEGHNYSDDLFMFVKRRVTGLEPNTVYDVKLELEIASNSPKNCFGIGGAPGESVYVKGGVSLVEPKAIADGTDYRMNIDKNNQSQSGRDAVVMGDMAVGDGNCSGPQDYEFKSFSTEDLKVVADEEGSAWIFFGTDSGYEGKTSMYYTNVGAVFTPLF